MAMTKFIAIAALSASVFYLCLMLWGRKQIRKAGPVPSALKCSFLDSNKDESWHLKN
jgi:hypothetical protein